MIVNDYYPIEVSIFSNTHAEVCKVCEYKFMIETEKYIAEVAR